MNVQSFDIQWIQQSAHDDVGDAIIVNGCGDGDSDGVYLDDGNGDTAVDLDQIAAENLIFMARDGQVADIIPTGTDEHGAVIVSASDGTQIDMMQQAGGITSLSIRDQPEDDDGVCYGLDRGEDFSDCTPQMVTEEVITDDWVQQQGEDRVEIAAEQIIGCNSQVLLDMEVPLPTDQDQYTLLRPYPCDFCSRRFRKKTSLLAHLAVHRSAKAHLCKLCGSRFIRKMDLIDHLKAHANANNDEDDFSLPDHHPNQSQRSDNERFYDPVWEIPNEGSSECINNTTTITTTITTTTKNSTRTIGRNKNQITRVSMSSSSTFNSTDHHYEPPTTTTRGRISRLKPKEENYVIDECLETLRTERIHSSEMDYVDCSTAAVKLTQDQSPAHQKHYPIIDNSKPFVCQECGLAFSREKALLAHTKNHRADSTYECPQCNDVFWDLVSLQDHQKTHQFEESNSEYDPAEGDDSDTDSESENPYGEYYCSECGVSFHRQELLRRHSKIHTKAISNDIEETVHQASAGQHCCNTCGETFTEALDLLAHAEIHARYPPFKCVLCGESFLEEVTIKRHLQSEHPKEMTSNSCILCGKACRDRKALIKHAWDHSREKCHSCSKCGKSFHNKARLKRHMASHRDKSVVCGVCQEEFPDGRSLSNHRHSHSAGSASGKMFPCHECGKTFGSRSSQQIHVRIHTGERPYGCRFCWKAFADGGTLRKHERIHTGEKPYACSVCPRAFNQRVVLREHIRSHHSHLDAQRGTYYCTVCSEELPSSSELMQHLIQHSDTNTAMQRQPITGPRKYKRRRKLKPHEIARMRSDKRTGHGSDIDLCDFDMDELLGLSSMASTSTGKDRKASGKTLSPKATTAKRSKTNNNTRKANNKNRNGGGDDYSQHDDDDDEDNDHGDDDDEKKHNEDGNDQKHQYNADQSVDVENIEVDVDVEGSHIDVKRPIKSQKLSPQSGGYKLWQTDKLMPSKEALLSNWDQRFLGMDSTLVVDANNGTTGVDAPIVGKQYKYKSEEGSSQRTQQVERIKTDTQISGGPKRRGKKSEKPLTKKGVGRPRMIHTEKWLVSNNEGGATKRRSKAFITRTEHSTMELLKPVKSSIVNDYEIISPESQVPTQISSSPVHIKQEDDSYSQRYQCTVDNRPGSRESPISNGNELYKGQLMMQTPTRRKTTSTTQYDPSIVNDLEEILQSPIKTDRLQLRQRYTIESSSQFMVDEQQHFIKIEPTSPDLCDIVASTGPNSVAQRRSARAARQRLNPSNRKYLDYETDLNTNKSSEIVVASQSSSPATANRNANKRSAMTKATTKRQQLSKEYQLDYEVNSLNSLTNERADSSSTLVPNAEHSSFVGMTRPPPPSPPTKSVKRTYFECEMCSLVFPDRSQLLDHVPIHI